MVRTDYLSNLPEELLEKVLTTFVAAADEDLYLDDIRSLSAVCLTSKKFHRIAEPLLYHNVPVYFTQDVQKRLDEHCSMNGQKLLATLQPQGDLRECVKTLQAIDCGIVEDQWLGNHLSDRMTQELFLLVPHLGRLMPNLERLDLRRIRCWSNCLDHLSIVFDNIRNGNGWNNLRRLDTVVATFELLSLLPVFQLPKIESVNLGIRQYTIGNAEVKLISQWSTIQSSMRQLNFTNETHSRLRYTPVLLASVLSRIQIMTNACPSLQAFRWVDDRNVNPVDLELLLVGLIQPLKPQLLDGVLRHFEVWSEHTRCGYTRESDVPAIPEAWLDPNIGITSLKLNMGMLFRDRITADVVAYMIPQSVQHLTLRQRPGQMSGHEFGYAQKALAFLRDQIEVASDFRNLRSIVLEIGQWLDSREIGVYIEKFKGLGVQVEVRHCN